MLKKHIQSLYKHDFSKHDYDKYYFGIRYLGNRYLLSKLAELNLKGKRILDIGSGRLILSSYLSSSGSSLVAFDLPKVFDDKCVKERAKSYSIDLVSSKIESGRKFRLPFKNSSFEIVLMTEVFEHLNFSPVFVLNEIRRVLKDKGYFILTTPNVHSFENKIRFFLNKNIYGNFEKYLIGSPFDYHWREFEKRELFYVLKQCDFRVMKSYYCNDILYNKYNSYLYKNLSQKIKAYLKKILYMLSSLFPGLKKQIIIFAIRN
jgi:SAM-dependent methyltransferase